MKQYISLLLALYSLLIILNLQIAETFTVNRFQIGTKSALTQKYFPLAFPLLRAEKKSEDITVQLPNKIQANSKCRGNADASLSGIKLPNRAFFMLVLGLFGFQQAAMADIIQPDIAAAATDGGFLQSFLLIFISEIGDKTFFIAGLLAAKYGRLISLAGSLGALAVMTVISTALGQIFHAVPSSITQGIPFDDYIAVLAFAYFGVKTLVDASQLEDGDSSGIDEEKAEAEEAVRDLESGIQQKKKSSTVALLLQVFSLVFAAEIGDRSFLSTIALSAALNPFAVAGGAVAAHGAATGIAVVGGALMSEYLSEKVIGYIGGSLFIVFAITTAVGIF